MEIRFGVIDDVILIKYVMFWWEEGYYIINIRFLKVGYYIMKINVWNFKKDIEVENVLNYIIKYNGK